MKFRLINIGPIKDAEIELGDVTLFLGLPSTGKSFALRSIYSSLIMLDNAYLGMLREKIFNTNAGAVGVDYITAYLDSLLALGNNVCDKDLINEIVSVVNGLGYNVKSSFSPTQDGCDITLTEEINPMPKISEIINEANRTIAQNVIENLKSSVEYDNSSIEINGEEIRKIVERIKPIFKVNQGQVSFSLPDFYFSGGKREVKVTINNKGDVVEFIANVTVKLFSAKEPSKVSVSEKDIKSAFTPGFSSFHRPFIFGILDLDNVLPKEIIKKILTTEFNSVTLIPYNRAQLVLSYNNLQRERINYLLVPHLVPQVLQSPDFSTTSYILHFDSGVKKIADKENEENVKRINEMINAILDLVKIKMEIVKLTPTATLLRYIVENKEIEPFYASAMVNEISGILLPLTDLRPPALVLIEEPESQLHLAYQLLLVLSLLSLVQYGYKFVISTHSDTFVAFIGDLARYKPDEDNLLQLLQEIFGKDIAESEFLKKVVKDSIKTIKNGKIKVYYFEGGKTEERDPTTVNFDVPGMTKKVIDKIALWEFDEEEKLYEATSHIQG